MTKEIDIVESGGSISAELRRIGAVIADEGQKIEDSQIEDGDPPYLVKKTTYECLHHCSVVLRDALDSIAVEAAEVKAVGGIAPGPYRIDEHGNWIPY